MEIDIEPRLLRVLTTAGVRAMAQPVSIPSPAFDCFLVRGERRSVVVKLAQESDQAQLFRESTALALLGRGPMASIALPMARVPRIVAPALGDLGLVIEAPPSQESLLNRSKKPDGAITMYRLLGTFFGRLHSHSAPTRGLAKALEAQPWAPLRRQATWLADLALNPVQQSAVRQAVTACRMQPPSSLVMGDCDPAWIGVSTSHGLWINGWTCASWGWPAQDLGRIRAYLHLYRHCVGVELSAWAHLWAAYAESVGVTESLECHVSRWFGLELLDLLHTRQKTVDELSTLSYELLLSDAVNALHGGP